jgi:signal peptidase II
VKYLFFLSLPLYGLDRLTKYLVMRYVSPDGPPPFAKDLFGLKNFFRLVNITNTGAAFGSFKNNNTFFIIISCIALFFVVGLLIRRRSWDVWRDVSLALLAAGVLGNLTDRILYGQVIDFLLFDFGSRAPSFLHPWPAFNVADSCICLAVVCFVIHSFRQEKSGTQPAG